MKARPDTLGALKRQSYTYRSVKQELRANLLASLKAGKNAFPGIIGYENTVVPDVEKAILAGHHINFLGLRGQAKTRLARLMTGLLDEFIPIIKDSVLREDPLYPISAWGKKQVELLGDDLPIEWIHREERYTEKLATPDVSVADLIGDIDPIKAATLKLSFSDEQVIHYGLIPRSNRGIFVINELPDLQARIQVALFNILQEGDIQVRGFKLRLPLDIQFIFTANPEDYTNRGSIVTPLKDRIESQILTHYPLSVADGLKITAQESHIWPEQSAVFVSSLLKDLVEQISFEARKSEYIDAKSGVSARLTIAAYETLVSTAERRMVLREETATHARITDLIGVIPAINGKVELVYEGEQEGQQNVALMLIGKSIRSIFPVLFPDPERIKRKKEPNPYLTIQQWFSDGNDIELPATASQKDYTSLLSGVKGLDVLVETTYPGLMDEEKFLMMEFLLFGMAEYSLLSRHIMDDRTAFKDLFNSVFSMNDDEDEQDQY